MNNKSYAKKIQALVTASFGNNYLLKIEQQINVIQATFKGKKNRAVVGDMVECDITAMINDIADQASINTILERKNLLYRSDAFKTKAFASNIDHVFLVVATEPSFNTELIDRAIVACNVANINISIILNKCDLLANLEKAHSKLNIYKQIGCDIIELSAISTYSNNNKLQNFFAAYQKMNKRCVFIGQSGMGKSSLINAFIPHAQLIVQDISARLDSGKHTTTHTKIIPFVQNDYNSGYLIDSPGFQLFGINHVSQSQIIHSFTEFTPYLGKCKFYNCTHRHEPDCAIINAVNTGDINQHRIDSYYTLLDELKNAPKY
jgi:ribosome biogenesis GTPase / thiamine phosphate phosphatase